MRLFLRRILAHALNDTMRQRLKAVEFGARKRLARIGSPLEAADFRRLFASEFALTPGDVVMVHGSMSLLNTRLSAAEIASLLREEIGPEGTMVVPTFPAVSSLRYMQQPGVFDARRERSGMGAISEFVRRMEGAVRSTHPVKSVAAVGPAAQEICAGHERCLFPFGPGSPYEKMLARNVKIIGIGAPMSYLSFVHVAEDLDPAAVTKPVWEAAVFEKDCVDLDGRTHRVRTRVHNMTTMQRANPEKFCRAHVASGARAIVRKGMADFFSVEGRALTEAIAAGLKRGVTVYD